MSRLARRDTHSTQLYAGTICGSKSSASSDDAPSFLGPFGVSSEASSTLPHNRNATSALAPTMRHTDAT